MANVGKWLNEEFPGWSVLSRPEKRNIRDFSVLWALFELRATGARASVQTIIQAVERIHEYVEDPATARAVSHFSQRYHACPIAVDRMAKLRLGDNALPVVNPVIRGDENDPKERLKAVLLIIHRLRNNYLHGEKARYAYHDQLDNFNVSNKALMAAIPLWEAQI